MKSNYTLALLLCFIVVTHTFKYYNISLQQNAKYILAKAFTVKYVGITVYSLQTIKNITLK